MKRAIACAAMVILVIVIGSVAHPAEARPSSRTQSIIYATYGCSNSINIRTLGKSGENEGTRTIVRARAGYEVIPLDVSIKPNVLLFGAFNCATGAAGLYSQRVGSKPLPRLIANLTSDTPLIDATWDIAREAPVMLLSDAAFNYSAQILLGGRWNVLWSSPRSSLGGYFLTGISSRPGQEFLLWGDDIRPSWKVWRLNDAGYLGTPLSGDGELYDVATSPLTSLNAYIGPSGTWACDWSASGEILSAISQKKCVPLPNSFARSGALFPTSNSVHTYNLVVDPVSSSTPGRFLIDCLGGDMFSCGEPQVIGTKVSDLRGKGFLYRSLFDIHNFNRLGASQVP